MSFLLSLFFSVPVSNMMGLLSLLLSWVFFMFCFYHGSLAELGFSCAWPPPCGGRTEVVSARLNPSHGAIDVGGVCNFLGSVSSQQKFEVTDQLLDGPVLQLHVTPQFYLGKKGKYILEA